MSFDPAITAANIAAITALNGGQPPKILPTLPDPNQMTLQISQAPFAITSGSITRTMNTGDDGMSCTTWWNEDLKDFDVFKELFMRPLGTLETRGYLGAVQMFGGRYYVDKQKKTKAGREKTIIAYSKTRDIIDSNIDTTYGETYEAKAVSLFQRCTQLTAARDIKVVLDLDPVVTAKANEPFVKVACGKTEKIFEHLMKLARKRGLLLSSTIQGDLFITRAKLTGLPVAVVAENKSTFPENYEISFDATKRFYKHTVVGQTENKAVPSTAFALDTKSLYTRTRTVVENNILPGAAQSVANARKNRTIADMYYIPWKVNSWYSDPAQLLLWQPNTLLTVAQSLTLNILTPFNFLIESVTYNFDNSGSSATLNLVPPGAYTDDLEVIEPYIEIGSGGLGLSI